MSSRPFPDGTVVAAALEGDAGAVETLLAESLHLVYNVIGRAAESDLDVDDIVQETMLRVVRGLSDVRSPDAYRPWLVSIAMRQLADARRRAGTARRVSSELPGDVQAPGGDPASLVDLRASLSQEQQQLVRAVQWLDEPYRDLLAQWWLQIAGRLSRKELAASLGISQAHLAVRVQRMKRQLDTARTVVRALSGGRRCPGLAALADTSGPSPLGRKRISRHLESCTTCTPPRRRLVDPERLLLGIPLLVPPACLGSMTQAIPPAETAAWAVDSGAAHAKAKVAGAIGAAVVTAGLLVGLPQMNGGQPEQRPASAVGVPAPGGATGTPSPVASPSATSRAKPSASAPSPLAERPAATPARPARPRFSTKTPALPAARIDSFRRLVQHGSVDGRDNGQSTRYGDRSVWIFDDTTLRDPWGFLSNSGATTTDLDATDGISLGSASPFSTKPGRPAELIPRTSTERAFERAHAKATGCTSGQDPYCGATFAFWPGPVVADEARHRVLVFYGKLCRGGADGTPCSGTMGKGLGTGVAALDMRSGEVTRLTADNGPTVKSVEGVDRTMFFPDGQGYSSSATVVGDEAYVHGDCDYGCRAARVPLSRLDDRSAWRFRTESGWSADPERGRRTIEPGGAGQTVFWNEALDAWVNVFMPYGTAEVKYQVGGSPYGPWSKSRTAGTVPSGEQKPYALFAHPEYARDNGRTQYLSYYDPSDGEQTTLRLRFRTG